MKDRNIENILSRAFNHEITFTVDSKGRKVRQFTAEAPCTEEDVYATLQGMRVVTVEQILEGVGQNVFNYFTRNGFLRKDSRSDFFWITKKAAALYGLSNPVTGKRYPA
jgi:hypothetical protein